MDATIIDTKEYLKLKLGNLPFSPEILEAMVIALKPGLNETIPTLGHLVNYNKELPTKVFSDLGNIRSDNIMERDGKKFGNFQSKDEFVILTSLASYQLSGKIIFD